MGQVVKLIIATPFLLISGACEDDANIHCNPIQKQELAVGNYIVSGVNGSEKHSFVGASVHITEEGLEVLYEKGDKEVVVKYNFAE